MNYDQLHTKPGTLLMLSEDTIALQRKMSAYCRKDGPTGLPVDSDFRLSQYRRLVFNVVKGTLTQAYPIAAKFLGHTQWEELVASFFAQHRCQHPQVWRMPQELIAFVKNAEYTHPTWPAYLIDLLRMEWLEIEVHSMPDRAIPKYIPTTSFLDVPLVFNPHHFIEAFSYPVHKIQEMEAAPSQGQWFLLIFRHMQTGKVHFMQLEPLFAAVLSSAIENPGAPVREVFNAVYDAHGIIPKKSDTDTLSASLVALANRDFILGKAAN